MTEHERTEAPTVHRWRMARRRGQVAPSRVLTSAVAWIAFAAVADWGGPRAWGALASFARTVWAPTFLTRARTWVAGGEAALRLIVGVLGWSCGATLVAAVMVGLLQTGANLRLEAIAPDFARLFAGRASRRGAGRHLGVGGIALVAIVLATLATFVELAPRLSRLGTSSPGGILVAGGIFTRQLAGRILVVLLVAGVGDGLWRRAQLRRELMMTKDEVKRETRELEGDVRLKVERRRRAASPDAGVESRRFDGSRGDVVVVGYSTQTGTCAVVLRYEDQEDPIHRVSGVAPGRALVVVAKGRGPVAESLVNGALALRLPVHEDLALANALWFVRVGAALPEILFKRVAKFFPEANLVTDGMGHRS